MDLDIRIREKFRVPNLDNINLFYDKAKKVIFELGETFQVRSLGGNEEGTSKILHFIKLGEKTGTFSLPWIAEEEGQAETISGDHIILCDYNGYPKIIVQINNPFLKRFDEIDNEITKLDGPTIREVKVWREIHLKYWNSLLLKYNKECKDDMPVLVEPFRVIYQE